MTTSKERPDEQLGGVENPEDSFGDKSLMKELKVRLMERMPIVIPRDSPSRLFFKCPVGQ